MRCRGVVSILWAWLRTGRAEGARLKEGALPGIDVHALDPGMGACDLEKRKSKGERAQFCIRKQAFRCLHCSVIEGCLRAEFLSTVKNKAGFPRV